MRKIVCFTAVSAIAFWIVLRAVDDRPLTRKVDYNIVPFLRFAIDGVPRAVNINAPLTRSESEVITDGTTDTLYLADVRLAANGSTLQLDLPFPMTVERLVVLGDGVQPPTEMTISLQDGSGAWQHLAPRKWSSGTGFPPYIAANLSAFRIQSVQIHFAGAERVTLNQIGVIVLLPRWKALGLFCLLAIIFPFVCGCVALLSLIYIGRAATAQSDINDPDIGVRLLVGILLSAGLAVLWCSAPRTFVSDAVIAAVILIAASIELVRLLRRLIQRNSSANDTLTFIALAAVLLVVTEVAIDTNVVAYRRMQPVDFLLPQMGAHRLADRITMGDELTLRPWLVHVLYAPWDHIMGRFSYWAYIGFLAGLNSLVVMSVGLIARRWNQARSWLYAALIALLPLHVIFNAVGQRPLAAAFCLLAVHWMIGENFPRRWLLIGLSLAIAVGVHPGSLFVLPGVFFYGLWLDESNRGFCTAMKWMAIPACCYSAWLMYIRFAYPGTKNALMYYPLMTTLTPFQNDLSLWQALNSLNADDWWMLIWNRVFHIRHYVWTDNLSEPIADVFRWVSLTNAFGICLVILLCVHCRLLRQEWRFAFLAIFGPLVVHHLYIGQAHPQFHISPVPFYAIGALIARALIWAASYKPASSALREALTWLIFVELLARRCFPLMVASLVPSTRGDELFRSLGMFGTDALSYAAIAAVLPLSWVTFAFASYTAIGTQSASQAK